MPPTIGLTVIQYLIFHACCVISHCRSCRFPICSASRHKPISAVMYNRISVSIRRVQNINLFNQTLLMIVGSIADILLYNGTML